jgi:hypothetical protein
VLKVQEAFPGLQGRPDVLGVTTTRNSAQQPCQAKQAWQGFLFLETVFFTMNTQQVIENRAEYLRVESFRYLLGVKRAKRFTARPDCRSG